MTKKISELTPATTPLGGTEMVEIVQGGVSKRVPANEIAALVAGISFSPVVSEALSARIAALTDAGKYIRFTSASPATYTLAPQLDVVWAAATEIHVRMAGVGSLTLTPGIGVTLNAPSGGTLVLTNGMTATVKRAAADVWDVIGQTVPV